MVASWKQRKEMQVNLKQWRKLKGYSLLEVAAMLDRASPSTIHYWEKIGIKRNKVRMELKRFSLGEITDFGGCSDE